MSLRTDLTTAIADHLADHEVGEWNPDGVYGKHDTAIFVAALPPAPNSALALALYPLSDDDNEQLDSVMGLQVRCRGGVDPRLTEALADAVFAVLHDLRDLPFGDADGLMLLARRMSSTTLSVDENARWELSENYHLTIHRP